MKIIGREEFVLAGDIGGTKTNLALFSPNKERPVLWVTESYSSRDTSSLVDLIENFLIHHSANVSAACFGIAGPVTKGSVKTTNLPWVVSEKKLKDCFKWKKIRLMNDLAATAVSVALLEQSEVFELNPGKPDPEGTIGVVAPGTGLGIALLVFVKGKPYPLPSEGGHVDFAPKDAQEMELFKHLLGQMDHVSVERLVSGPGLFTIYSWLKDYRRHTEPKWLQVQFNLKDASQAVSEAALVEKEPLCVESLDLFISILGSASGNLVLAGMTTGGIYLAGGICPKILPKLTEGGFMKAFTAKGRFEQFLSGIPVRVILNDKAALLGAARCASDLLALQDRSSNP